MRGDPTGGMVVEYGRLGFKSWPQSRHLTFLSKLKLRGADGHRGNTDLTKPSSSFSDIVHLMPFAYG